MNPPKEEQSLDTDGADTVQYQQRKHLDDGKPKKRKGKSSMGYNQARTELLIWANGTAPVGEVKCFSRFGELHYYEKTEDGFVELSRAQYDERNDFDAQNTYARVQRQTGKAVDRDGSSERDLPGSFDGDRDSGGTAAVLGQAIGEELRNDAGRGLPSGSGNN